MNGWNHNDTEDLEEGRHAQPSDSLLHLWEKGRG